MSPGLHKIVKEFQAASVGPFGAFEKVFLWNREAALD